MDKKRDNSATNPNATGEWRIDPRDAQLHRRRLKEAQRVGPLGKLFRAAAAVMVLAGGVAVYLNWDTLRGMSVSFAGLTNAFDRAPGATGNSGAPGSVEPAIVEAPSVAGDALPSSIESEPSAEPEAVPQPAAGALAADAAPSVAEAASPPEPAAPPEPDTPETFEFGLATVTVSEADASAAVLVLRNGGRRRPSAITWWTTNGTATAGSDFANLGAQVLRFAASEQNRSIRVPIIGDRNVEGPETFIVHIAPGDDTNATRDEVARVEIVIGDDD